MCSDSLCVRRTQLKDLVFEIFGTSRAVVPTLFE